MTKWRVTFRATIDDEKAPAELFYLGKRSGKFLEEHIVLSPFEGTPLPGISDIIVVSFKKTEEKQG